MATKKETTLNEGVAPAYNTKRTPKRVSTQLSRNKSIIGDSIEIMIERLQAGEGVEGIEDRDLVYNDRETDNVNPLTDMRSDRHELMLDQKIDEYGFKHRKTAPQAKEVEEENTEESGE